MLNYLFPSFKKSTILKQHLIYTKDNQFLAAPFCTKIFFNLMILSEPLLSFRKKTCSFGIRITSFPPEIFGQDQTCLQHVLKKHFFYMEMKFSHLEKQTKMYFDERNFFLLMISYF